MQVQKLTLQDNHQLVKVINNKNFLIILFIILNKIYS